MILFFMFSSSILQLGLSAAMHGVGLAQPGPYAIVFGVFVYFFARIPSVSSVKLVGIPLGEKAIMYLLGAQVYVVRFRLTLVIFTMVTAGAGKYAYG